MVPIYSGPHFDTISRDAKHFLSALLRASPQRLTAAQAVEHPWFQQASLPMQPLNDALCIPTIRT